MSCGHRLSLSGGHDAAQQQKDPYKQCADGVGGSKHARVAAALDGLRTSYLASYRHTSTKN